MDHDPIDYLLILYFSSFYFLMPMVALARAADVEYWIGGAAIP